MKLAAVFAFVVLGVQAQTINGHLEALVAPYREVNAPGMVAISIREGPVAWQTAFGLADLETHRPITLDTQFELASMTRQFTAMAIMILSEQGKLEFGDTLDKYCPEFPAYARTIHIRDLLHHVSGLPDYEELMVGKIGGNFFRAWEKIFDPLGMRDTLVLDERKRSGPRLALAYKKRNARWEDITYSPENYEYGDGGVESTGNGIRRLVPGNWFAAPRSIWLLRPAAPTMARSSRRASSTIPALMDLTAIVLTNSSNNDVARIAHRIIEIAGN